MVRPANVRTIRISKTVLIPVCTAFMAVYPSIASAAGDEDLDQKMQNFLRKAQELYKIEERSAPNPGPLQPSTTIKPKEPVFKTTAVPPKNPPKNPAAKPRKVSNIKAIAARIRSVYPKAKSVSLPENDNRDIGIPVGEELVFSLVLDRYLLNQELITEKSDDGLLIDLDSFFRAVEFPISVDPKNATATGWFIREENLFRLDVNAGTVQIAERRLSVDPATVQVRDTGIWVTDDTIGDWIESTLEVNYRELQINIKPKVQLPIQERENRRKKFETRSKGKNEPPELALAPAGDRYWTSPTVDFQLSGRTQDSSGGINNTATYSINARNEFLKGGTKLFASGTHDDPLENLRITLTYADPSSKMLGPMEASLVELGDVRSTYSSLLDSGFLERGIRVDNLPLGKGGSGGSTIISGDLAPNWDVELYRDNAFIDALTVGSDGRYEFRNVRLFEGPNEFKLIFYGPQGQRQERTETINGGAESLISNKINYEISLTQGGTDLIPVGDDSTDGGDPRFATTLRYDVADKFTVGGHFETFDDNGDRRDIFEVGIQGKIGQTSGTFNIAQDLSAGQAAELLLQSRVNETGIRFEQELYNDFTKASDDPNPVYSTTDLELTRSLGTLGEGGPFFSANGGTEFEVFESGQKTWDIDAQLTANFGAANFTKNFQWNYTYGGAAVGTTSFGGFLQFYSRFGPATLRGKADYTVKPDPSIDDFLINANYAFSPKFKPSAEVRHTISGDLTTASASLNYDFGKALVSPRVSIDSGGATSAFVAVRFGLGRDPFEGKFRFNSKPITSQGLIAVRVFIDNDGNGQYSAGDQPVEGAKIQAVHANRSGQTDETGVALISHVRPFETTDVVLDANSLPDPFLSPSVAGYSTVPRPGIMREINLPVVWSKELEGVAYTRRPDGGTSTLANTDIILRRMSDGTETRVKTAGDGFFLFEKIHPDFYVLSIDPDALSKFGMIGPESQILDMRISQNTKSGIEIVAAYDGQLPGGMAGATVKGPSNLQPLHIASSGSAESEPQAAAPEKTEIETISMVFITRTDTKFKLLGSLALLNQAHPALVEEHGTMASKPPPGLSGQNLYLGPFAGPSAANSICSDLGEAWPDCRLVAIPKPMYDAELTLIDGSTAGPDRPLAAANTSRIKS